MFKLLAFLCALGMVAFIGVCVYYFLTGVDRSGGSTAAAFTCALLCYLGAFFAAEGR